jgi:DNA topoisomerase IB
MFAVMKDTDYAAKQMFIDNFFTDWRKILGKNHIIKEFELCDFTPIYEWHLREKEKKKQMTSEVTACNLCLIKLYVRLIVHIDVLPEKLGNLFCVFLLKCRLRYRRKKH